MLQTIRDRTQGVFAGIIITILVLTFLLWGVSSYKTSSLGGGSQNIATVNGQPIEFSV